MSRLFPKRYRLGLGATYAALAEVRGGMLMNWRMQAWAANTATNWQTSLAAAVTWLRELEAHGAKVSIVLSAELAPLQLLPWRDDATRTKQQELIASAQFRRIHGEVVVSRRIRVQPTGYGQPWLASAMDERLLAALTEQLQAAGASVAGVRPLPLTLFNTARGRLRGSAGWLIIAEPQWVTAIHWRDNYCQLLQTLPASALQGEALRELLQRETRLANLPDRSCNYYLFGPPSLRLADCSALDAGWKFHASVTQDSPCYLLGGRT